MHTRNSPAPGADAHSLATAGAVLVGLAILSLAASGAVAAQEVAVSIQPAESELPAGEASEFLLVVEDADSGVDGYELNVTLSDATVAEITAVNTTGDPPFDLTRVGDNGTSVSFEAAMGESGLDPGDEVVIGTVTVVGTAPGESATLTIAEDAAVIGADSVQYSVEELHSATFEVVETASGDGDDDSQPGGDDPSDGGDDGDDRASEGDQSDDGDGQTSAGDDSDDSEDGSGPGFGIVGAVGALLAVGARVLVGAGTDAGND